MFDTNQLFKMAGIKPEVINNLMAAKAMMDKLPKQKQVEIVSDFIKALEMAVKEEEGKSNEQKD